MREGTPSGFSTTSTGVPSSRYGMSSTGTMVEITPLLPCRPAILSPGCTRRFTARYTLTILSTPGARSSPAVILRLLVVEALLERLALQLQPLGGLLELRVGLLVLETDLEPLLARHLIEVFGC